MLELCICYLLAVVATTPLRTDMDALVGGPCSSCSPLLCCQGEGGECGKCGGEPQPAHLDEEIYTEIVVNNHTSRFNGVEGKIHYLHLFLYVDSLSRDRGEIAM